LEPLRIVCPLTEAKRARSREEGKYQTRERNTALQREFNRIKRYEFLKASQRGSKKPTKEMLCKILESDPTSNPESVTVDRLIRILRMR